MNKTKKYYNEYYENDEELYKVRYNIQKKPFDPLKMFSTLNCNGSLLDIGCGRGWFLGKAKERGIKKCFGVDLSIKVLKTTKKTKSIDVVCCDVNLGLPFNKSDIFDYIVCWGSLEHFESQDLVINEIYNLCKPHGEIIIQVPNDNYFLHKLGYETDNQIIINRHNLRGWVTLLESNGLKVYTVIRGNYHLSNLNESTSHIKLFLKLCFYPFLRFIPLSLSDCFIFLCKPS